MNLLRLRADGFGPLRGEWSFAPRLVNLVVDDNERGKSSLIAAIAAGLYGLDDDRRSHRVLTPRERWRPWAGGAYRVELELEVGDRKLRIARDFERNSVTVFDGQGREVTAEFAEGRDEFPVGRKLLGLDAAEFEKCAFVRQGDLDGIVPGDEKARRASSLRARLENAADTHVGDTNASEAMRVLDEALRRYDAPELEFTGTIENAIDRLEAKLAFDGSKLHELEQEIERARAPLERLAALADEEDALRATLEELEAERHAGLALEVKRQVEKDDTNRAELAALEQEAAGLEGVSRLSASADADLREAVTRLEEAQRNLETLESRRQEEIAAERDNLRAEMANLSAYEAFTEDDANRCVGFAAELRRLSMDDAQLRQQMFGLRDHLASRGYEPEHIQFLTARFSGLPDEPQRLLRRQSEASLAFQTEVARLEQERTEASETLRAVDGSRSRRRVPGWFALALGLGSTSAGVVVLALHGPAGAGAGLAGSGLALAALGVALLLIGARSQAAERDTALRRLGEAQRQLNLLRSERAKYEIALADLARHMGYRDAIDLMRHWAEYSRMVEDSAPLTRAQEQLSVLEAQRRRLLDQAQPHLKPLGDVAASPEALERVAYEGRRMAQARARLSELDRSWEHVRREREIHEVEIAGRRERAVRILQAAGLTHDPERPWTDHIADLAARAAQRARHAMLVDELIPYAKRQLLPGAEREQRERRLEQLAAERGGLGEARPSDEIDAAARAARERLESVQKDRSDLRVEVDEIGRRYAQQRPELEAQLERLRRALERARAFRSAATLARETIQKVAVDTHRRWAEFLNTRVAELLGRFGARVEQLRFGEDLDFSVQMDGGPQVSRGKADLQLSTGARDQLYLAVRLAVSEFISRGAEALPLLIDDAFATSDDARLEAGMRALLESFGAGHQLILLTCHRGRHLELQRHAPELFGDRVRWLDLGTPSAART
ncbi:MAG TPA: hypothetical protein VMH61_03835 [Candidatus Acidoferrales bacterium]|nr:hypothetical protein [Candidatus Acidoferrales bacterium]